MPPSMPMAMRLLRWIAVLVVAGMAASCGGGGGSEARELALRVINAVPDSPALNLKFDGGNSGTLLNYKQGTGFRILTAREYAIRLEAVQPGDDDAVVNLPAQNLVAGFEYTLFAVGTIATAVESFIYERAVSRVSAGKFRVELAHLAAGAGAVDIYVTDPSATLAASGPVASGLTYKTVSSPQEFPQGSWRIRVTPAGNAASVLFDSGTVTFAEFTDLLIGVVPSTSAGTAPVSLILNDGNAGSELIDAAAPIAIRTIPASPDAPVLALRVDNVDFETNLQFADGFRPYRTAQLQPESLKVTLLRPDNTTVLERFQAVGRGQRLTVLIDGLAAATTPNLGFQLLTEEIRPIGTEGRLRLYQSAPGAGTVDVYVAAPGANLANETPDIEDFAPGLTTRFLSFEPGNYTVTVTKQNAPTDPPVTTPVDVALTAGRVLTLQLRDSPRPTPSSDGKPTQTLLIDELTQ